MTYELRSARFLASDVRRLVLRPGDTAVDATLGNGHDTVELAQLVGPAGHVYGFDIQPAAVASARSRLQAEGLLSRCTLLCTGHETMAEYVRPGVRYISFNLGWLPGGDKQITTLWETTHRAVLSALDLLSPLGVMTICAYPGHGEGARERSELVSLFSGLRPQDFNVLRQTFLNAGPGAPECFVIQKQASASM